MKHLIPFSIASILAFLLTITIISPACAPEGAGKELVVFYEVPLACGAAPDLGCGSRAKPVFIEMEKHANVKEAWLDRSGTVMAFVGGPSISDWNELAAIVEPILNEYDVNATHVGDNRHQDELMTHFRAEGKWYKGTDVDKLSIEEAGRIADDAVKYAGEADLIDEQESKVIRSEVEIYFKRELVKVRTMEELEAAGDQWWNEVYNIYEKQIGKERAAKVRRLYDEY